MIRKTLTILSLIGLLLSVGLWAASYFNVEYVSSRRQTHSVRVANGLLRVSQSMLIYEEPDPSWIGLHSSGFTGFHTSWTPSYSYNKNSRFGYWRVAIPFWIPTSLFSIILLPPLVQSYRRRERKKLGLCVNCGYDLRGSKDRCPECGSAIDALTAKAEC
ncbi:MAG: hypothetical protein IH895_00775 [Planctomycetes bacterium]|nr:hypothetical protein [Planctomycetota bacterium]